MAVRALRTDKDLRPQLDKKTVIFIDGDDTLWDTQGLYDRAISDAREEISLKGLDVTHWGEAVHEAEMDLMPRYGFAKERFAAALAHAYSALCRQQGKKQSVELSDTIQRLGMRVFEETAPLLPGAAETVETLSARVPLYLVSAGPEDVQEKRLLQSGVRRLLSGYHFPSKKTKDVFARLIGELEVEPGNSWHIGNSIKSDINPAIESGLNAILVGDRGWGYDKDELREAMTRFERVSQLYDVILILRRYYRWSDEIVQHKGEQL